MRNQSFTAAIIGGGPAGCQCALWLKMLGLQPLIIEQSDHLGGLQAENPYQNQWIVGVRDSTGRELAKNIQQHIQDKDISVIFNATVASFERHDNKFSLEVAGQNIQAKYLILASGSMPCHDDQDLKNRAALECQDLHKEFITNQAASLKGRWQANLPTVFSFLRESLLNKEGFIITDHQCETPVAGIYAIGEIANRMNPSVVTSMADGVVAAKAIYLKSSKTSLK